MFLGGLLYSAFYYVVLILYVIVAFLLIAIFSSASYILEGDTDQLADNLASEPGGMVLIAVLILLFFVTLLLPHSFWTAGAYGAASASVFRGEWSIFHDGIQALVENVRSANPIDPFFHRARPAHAALHQFSCCKRGLGSRPPDLSLAVFHSALCPVHRISLDIPALSSDHDR